MTATTVTATRSALEERAQIAHVTTTTDTLGRKQPSRKPKIWDPHAALKRVKAPFGRLADALEIEAQAKRRLADEYDAAQARGEVAGSCEGRPRRSGVERLPDASDLGLTRKQIHEARQVRDAEKAAPPRA